MLEAHSAFLEQLIEDSNSPSVGQPPRKMVIFTPERDMLYLSLAMTVFLAVIFFFVWLALSQVISFAHALRNHAEVCGAVHVLAARYATSVTYRR